MEQSYNDSAAPSDDTDVVLTRRLKAAQKKVASGPAERRAAVIDAKSEGWSDYRIAKVLGVNQSTVRYILAALKPSKGAPE